MKKQSTKEKKGAKLKAWLKRLEDTYQRQEALHKITNDTSNALREWIKNEIEYFKNESKIKETELTDDEVKEIQNYVIIKVLKYLVLNNKN